MISADQDYSESVWGYLDMLRHEVGQHMNASYSKDGYVRSNYYLITNRLNYNTSALDVEKSINFALYQSRLFHRHLCNQIVKNNKRKQSRKYLPIGLSFVDFPKSRYNNPYIYEAPHLHSVYCLHSATIERFEERLESIIVAPKITRTTKMITGDVQEVLHNLHCIQSTNICRVRDTTEDLLKVIKYASKMETMTKSLPYKIREVVDLYEPHIGLY